VFEQLTVFENLELALAGSRRSENVACRITARATKRIDEVLDIIGLSAQRGAPEEYSRMAEAVARNRHAADAEPGAAPG